MLLSQIRKIYDDSEGRYGSPRVYQELRREGVTVGKNRVAKVMQQWGMRARVTRVHRRLARRRHELKALPNYRLGAPAPDAVDQQWSSDVTYIRGIPKNYSLHF